MATWHQQRNPNPLWHETKWTVVEDPPDGLLAVSRWDTSAQANEHASKVKHAYVLAPNRRA